MYLLDYIYTRELSNKPFLVSLLLDHKLLSRASPPAYFKMLIKIVLVLEHNNALKFLVHTSASIRDCISAPGRSLTYTGPIVSLIPQVDT